jgi:hypothetical protein
VSFAVRAAVIVRADVEAEKQMLRTAREDLRGFTASQSCTGANLVHQPR